MSSSASPMTPAASVAVPAGVRSARVVRTDGVTVVDRCKLATTFGRRLRGLMGRASLPVGEGLLLRPAGSVHTFFMRFPIDVVVLDGELRVLSVAPAVRPWRAAGARGGRAVLELPAGEAARRGIGAGDVLQLEAYDPG